MLVTLGHPLLAELDEVIEGIAALGHGELRQADRPELDLDVAALGDLERRRERVRVRREIVRHLVRGLEVELVGVEAPVVRVLERVPGLDAEERLVRARVLVAEVVDVAGGDERQARALGEAGQLGVDSRLRLEARVLDLDVGLVAAEDLEEPVEVTRRVGLARFLERLRDASREAAGERDQTCRVPLQQLPVDARLVVIPLQIARRGELDEVAVACARLGQEGQVGIALLLPGRVVADVDLAADDRLDALLACLLVELHRARERPVVGERDGGHLELGGAGGKGRDAAGAIENRKLGVDVQVDELGTHSWAIVGSAGDGTRDRSPSSQSSMLSVWSTVRTRYSVLY